MAIADQLAFIIFLPLCLITLSRALKYVENQQYWTLRIGLSLWRPYVAAPCYIVFVLCALSVVWSFAPHLSFPGRLTFLLAGCVNAVFLILLIEYAVPFVEHCKYTRLRWKAWSGRSRTAIPSTLLQYVGDQRDWVALSLSVGTPSVHPVERFAWLFSPLSSKLLTDPTDLLRARAALDHETSSVWVPRSEDKIGLYQPVLPDKPASLLWGEDLGFLRRCSRGVISVPRALLVAWPTTETGFDGRPICLAYGILARNKGLVPSKLICNLEVKNSFFQFEENSIFWPRPAKTLRGFYRAEFHRTFSLLGPSYVTAATELALLLTDASHELITDWLDGQMEHQDLPFNNRVSDLGATPDELARLYRGHYAAMLVSLSAHRMGIRVRPELLVYDAVCRHEGVVVPSGGWAVTAPEMRARKELELQQLGQRVTGLIDAII